MLFSKKDKTEKKEKKQNAQAVIGGLISKIFDANRDMLKEIYFKVQAEGIDELEREEFDKAWAEAIKPYYEKCAAIAFDTIRRSSPELEKRVIETLKNPEIAGYPDKTDFMYPSYIYLLAYYMYTGKKGSSYYGKQADKFCNETVQIWLSEWDKELDKPEEDPDDDFEEEYDDEEEGKDEGDEKE